MKKIIPLMLLFLLLVSFPLFSNAIGATKVDNTGYKGKSYVNILPDNNILSSNAPEPRANHTAIWTGDKMIIWGGCNASYDQLGDGNIYNPSNDNWQLVSGQGDPSARLNHTAIWTGEKMIIWGGKYLGGLYNTGGSYELTSNSWQAISIDGAPTKRSWHTAIWTGEKMIVWGGLGSISSLNTGGIYDPSTNTWQAISSDGAPSPRYKHTVVWTGDKMIVWGGQSGSSGFINDGGIYDPSSNTWQAISITNAPSARAEHTAIWTGSEMIIWGGSDGSNIFEDGRIYNKSTNTWQNMSTEGVPSGRRSHTAVWAQDKMIVWGGRGEGGLPTNTDGIYDRTTNTWQNHEWYEDTPSARSKHTGIWTGEKMIIWGGVNDGNYLNDGGMFDPILEKWKSIFEIGDSITQFETYNATSIYYSQRPWIEGALFSGSGYSSYNGDNGLTNKTVTLWGKEFRDPEWTKIGDITTETWQGLRGLFGVEITGVRHNMYFYTSFAGDPTYAASQSPAMRTVVKARITVGGRLYRRVLRVYGKVYPSKANRGVKVYIAKSGGRWRGYSARLDRYSRYHFDYRRRRGTYYYRVYYPGDVYNGRSWSSRRTIRIR